MRSNTFHRNLLSALAGSTPSFTIASAKEYEGTGRRLLSALAGSSRAFQSGASDEYRLTLRLPDGTEGQIVFWGPPGRGKSPLITRLVNEAIAEGKTVLVTSATGQPISVITNPDAPMEANSVAAVDFGSELTEQAAVSTLDGRNISEAADALPQLAASLDLLAGFLGKAGHWHDAHAAAEEAVGIYRRITAVEPAGFRAELARSIGNLAVALGEIGRVDEAIDLAQESVTLSRRLAGREQSQEAQPQKS